MSLIKLILNLVPALIFLNWTNVFSLGGYRNWASKCLTLYSLCLSCCCFHFAKYSTSIWLRGLIRTCSLLIGQRNSISRKQILKFVHWGSEFRATLSYGDFKCPYRQNSYFVIWFYFSPQFDLDKMQSFLEVLKTFKFAAILVHHTHQPSLLFEWVVTQIKEHVTSGLTYLACFTSVNLAS